MGHSHVTVTQRASLLIMTGRAVSRIETKKKSQKKRNTVSGFPMNQTCTSDSDAEDDNAPAALGRCKPFLFLWGVLWAEAGRSGCSPEESLILGLWFWKEINKNRCMIWLQRGNADVIILAVRIGLVVGIGALCWPCLVQMLKQKSGQWKKTARLITLCREYIFVYSLASPR